MRLSANKRSTSSGKRGGDKGRGDRGKPKKHRSGDLGRALRTVYDDTLREPVPDDFLDLIGKLT